MNTKRGLITLTIVLSLVLGACGLLPSQATPAPVPAVPSVAPATATTTLPLASTVEVVAVNTVEVVPSATLPVVEHTKPYWSTNVDRVPNGTELTLTFHYNGQGNTVVCLDDGGKELVEGKTKSVYPYDDTINGYGIAVCTNTSGDTFYAETVMVEAYDPAAELETWKFDYPEAGEAAGNGWAISGLPVSVDPASVLVASGEFVNTIGLGTQSWLAEKGMLLVGPEFEQAKIDAAGGAIERISPINQKLIDESGEAFHLNEDRIDFCSFGAANLEFNGIMAEFEHSEGHNWFLIIRGLFADGLQDTDRNHTILFHEVVGSHAQCMSYPGNGGGFVSEGNFEQTTALSHQNAGDCGAEGCSKLTVVLVDLNTGALSVVTQANLDKPWLFEYSNWFQP